MSMRNFHFEGFEDDVKILYFGSMFRGIDRANWNINIGFYPRQDKSSLTVSQAPVLVRDRYLNPTVDHPPTGLKRWLNIDSTEYWSVVRVEDCPVFKDKKLAASGARQFCFHFRDSRGMEVYLPQFELARVLFLHDGYLARTALEPDSLKAEFDVQFNASRTVAQINVMETSNYPLRSLGDDGARRVLSWILLDPEARKSFESIGRYQKAYGEEDGKYRRWDFQFDPPALPKGRFGVLGRFAENSLFVCEIFSVRNIDADMPEEIGMHHPRFREAVQGGDSGTGGADKEFHGEFDIDDEVPPSERNNHILLRAPMVQFEFASAFKVSKKPVKKQVSGTGRKDEEVSAEERLEVGTNESSVVGKVPQADWDIVSDATDDSHLYAKKFDCFQSMLDQLVTEYGCVIQSKQIRKLPKQYKCKRYLMADGNPRCVAVVELAVAGWVFHVLEVDTSDAAKSLSTQLLMVREPDRWNDHLEWLEKFLVKNSLRWPTKILRQICGAKGYRGIPHPKSNSLHKGALEPESVDHWAERFYCWIEEMAGLRG